MVIVVMGPSGAGKSTVGHALARALGWPLHEGDDHHPPENVARMRGGVPLTDADRAPWLARLAALVAEAAHADRPLILTCSALKRAYRAALVPAGPMGDAVRFVYLRAPRALLAARLAGRAGHFFPGALLDSQLAALEEPDDDREAAPVLTLDASADPAALVARIREALGV